MWSCREQAAADLFHGAVGVVFDCDGVMLDSRAANVRFYNLIREHFGLGPMGADDEHFVHMANVHQSLARILPPERVAEAHAMRAEFDYRRIMPHTRLSPGLVEFLGALVRRGYRLGVNTNRTTTMELVLGWYELTHFFAPVVTSIKLANSKPHPESLHYVANCWRVAPHRMLFMGDSSVDAATAANAGVPFIAFDNPALQADLHVKDFGQLLALLRRTTPAD